MKKVSIAVLGAALLGSLAFGGDELVQSLSASLLADGGSGLPVCSSALQIKAPYAVQCKTQNAHVEISSLGDGGSGVGLNSVLLNAGVLYDVDTTGLKNFICILGQDAGVAKCEVYFHSSTKN